MIPFKSVATTAIVVSALCGAAPAFADEPLFGYIYTTDTLPQGKKEIEQWVTAREWRSQGDFHLIQTKTEASIGVTDNFQLSGYLNFAYTNVNKNTPSGDTAPPEVFADFTVDPDRRFSKARFEGVAVEALWRIASPYTKPIGIALYVEPLIGPRTRELESRLIIQKNFMDDKLVFAANLTVEQELRKLHADPTADPGTVEATTHWDKETDINFGIAGSYRFRPKMSAGFEIQNEHEFASFNPFQSGVRTNEAWYAGPTLHYGGRHMFATATFLAQLPVAHDYANPAPGFVVHGLTNGDDFEKYRLRVKVGYYF